MTREELYKIAKRYAHDELKDNHGDVEDIVASAFIDGVNYADAHPRWISVEDELPPKDKATVHCAYRPKGYSRDTPNKKCSLCAKCDDATRRICL